MSPKFISFISVAVASIGTALCGCMYRRDRNNKFLWLYAAVLLCILNFCVQSLTKP